MEHQPPAGLQSSRRDAGAPPALLVRAVDWLIAMRVPWFALCMVAAALAYGPAGRLEFDRSVEGLFDRDDPRLVNYLEDRRLFGGSE